ncbi:ATP-grasp domain-containing protein [Aphelenchoides fujianensis]|nr:ATP-grasp domain-containing protein [Aphelenchoides fujianensis]
MLSEEQTAVLRSLQASKRRVVLLFKWRYPFFTRLENFEKPADCGLVGVFSTAIRPKLFDGFEQHYDSIVWFEADFSGVEDAYSGEGAVKVDELAAIVGEIVRVVDAQKIRLLDCEEATMDAACEVRQAYGIPGPKPGELDRLRDKGQLKAACREGGIPIARFSIVDFALAEDVELLARRVEAEVGGFPAFRKPLNGFGSGGGGEITDAADLRRFLREQSGRPAKFLVEECIRRREFWASLVLLENGEWRPLKVLHCGAHTSRENLDAGQPIPFIAMRFEEAERGEFPRITEFVDLVVRQLRPPHPHVFCVQGFQLRPGKSEYLFTECGYRLNGARGTGLSYKASGVSQETAFLLAYMIPDYAATPDPKRKTTAAAAWWPSRPGVLKSHSEPSTAHLRSRVRFSWHTPVGSRLEAASSYNHFVVNAEVQHEEQRMVEEDLQWLMANWKPQIE